jgi:hyperosmotically inducible periplasmic protein
MNRIIAHSMLLAALGSTYALAQTTAAAPAADNTEANSAPVNSAMKASIADGQTNMASDLKITQRIRKSVMADKDLSTYAHNVKIVSVNGAVTLNGVVKSEHEKSAVEMKAQAVVGKDRVTNDLTIAPKG